MGEQKYQILYLWKQQQKKPLVNPIIFIDSII